MATVESLAPVFGKGQFGTVDQISALEIVADKSAKPRAVQVDRPVAVAYVVQHNGVVGKRRAAVGTRPVLGKGRRAIRRHCQ